MLRLTHITVTLVSMSGTFALSGCKKRCCVVSRIKLGLALLPSYPLLCSITDKVRVTLTPLLTRLGGE
jgi:hypothetical protein